MIVGLAPTPNSATIRPLNMTRMRSDSDMISSSSVDTIRTPSPSSRAADDPLVDVLDRADVDAARRLRRDQQLGVARQLAGHDQLLLVAARKMPGTASNTRGCAHRSRSTPPQRLRRRPASCMTGPAEKGGS